MYRIFAALVLVVAGFAGYRIYETRTFFEAHSLLSRFPAEDAAVLSVDVAALRRAGLLTESADSKTTLEPEYRQFVEGAGFDYKRDLDLLVAAFGDSGNYFIARGRFDWKKIRAYTLHAGGTCYEQLCRVQGSTPDRHISFLPLRSDAMALAVSTNDLAATRLTSPVNPITAPIPSAPVWFSIPGTQLRKPTTLPSSLHLMLSALGSTDRVLLTLASNRIHLETTCRTPGDARILASQLRTITSTLKDALSKDTNDEFALTLTKGAFDQSERKVTGNWPVGKGLLDQLTEGI